MNGALTAAISSGESASNRSPAFSGSSLGTQSGRPAITSWSEVLPACWSCTAIAAPCAWTRSVSARNAGTNSSRESPMLFGFETPDGHATPVTPTMIMPTPPFARSS